MLTKQVRVRIAVISLTAFSHRIFKHKTIVTENISGENIRQYFNFSAAVRICSRSSYFLSFIEYLLKTNSFLFDLPCILCLQCFDALGWATGRASVL